MPKPLSAVDAIGPAFTQTKQQLFAPFRWQRWSRLAVVCLLTGEFAGGGGGSSGRFNLPVAQPRGRRGLLALSHPGWDKVLPWLPWIVAGVALMLLLVFLWIYVASVYRFVLLDSVLYDRCELKGSWRRWEPSGRSYFFWSLSLAIVFGITICLLIGTPLFLAWRAGLFHHPGGHLPVLILGGAAILLLLFAAIVVSAVASLFAKDFCVPIMAMEKMGVLDAWRRLFPMLAAEKMAFAGYVLMKIVLAVGSAIIFGLITLVTVIIVLVPLGIAGAIIFFGGKAIGLTFNPATVCILAAMGCIVVAGILYLIALISTPPMVFFQSYMLHFFGSRYPQLGAVVFPPPPETLPPSAPQIPPPLEGPPLIEPSIG